MENKYYTPSIEEFHVGFEYEISAKEEGRKLVPFRNGEEWKKEVFETEFYFVRGVLNNHTSCIRVKHLDREDIESLGFEFKGKALRSFFEMECQFDLPDTNSFWCKTLKIQLDEEHRTVKIEGYIASACEEETLFSGKCKNKSELKRILKMIGYEQG